VSIGDDETDDAEYGKSLQEQFGDRVKIIPVHEKSENISAPVVRNILTTGDFEAFADSIPAAAYNRGAAPKIFKMLASKVKVNEPEKA
jgi:citrate lyase synthetase